MQKKECTRQSHPVLRSRTSEPNKIKFPIPFGGLDDIQLEDVEEALLYLSKIGSLKLEGGFLVLYNAMNIKE